MNINVTVCDSCGKPIKKQKDKRVLNVALSGIVYIKDLCVDCADKFELHMNKMFSLTEKDIMKQMNIEQDTEVLFEEESTSNETKEEFSEEISITKEDVKEETVDVKEDVTESNPIKEIRVHASINQARKYMARPSLPKASASLSDTIKSTDKLDTITEVKTSSVQKGPLSRYQKQLVKSLHMQGKPFDEIVAAVGRQETVVRNYITNYIETGRVDKNLKEDVVKPVPKIVKEKSTPKVVEQKEKVDEGKIMALSRAGWTPISIARDMYIDVEIVKEVLAKNRK